MQVPFRITDIDLGFEEADGWVRYEDGCIVFEYRVRDALGIVIKSDHNTLCLSLSELTGLEVRDWWITMRLILSVTSGSLTDKLPNAHSNVLNMKVPRKYRESLNQFVSVTRRALREREVKAGSSP